MATPVLAALRADYPNARISYLMRAYVREVVAGGNWHDAEIFWPQQKGLQREVRMLDLARRLRGERFDLALLLTNSFRSALVAWMGRIPSRIGYARDGRSWLLSERLRPLRQNGHFVPFPVLDYYIALAERIGCTVADRRLRLEATAEQERAGHELKRHYGLDANTAYAVINPGAAFGASKCWLPERFAELCDRIQDELGLQAVIVGAPGEKPLMRHIAGLARGRLVCIDEPGTTLGSLKPLIRDATVLVCNDTGPRHYGSAFAVPTVTIFGPTHQQWTDTEYDREIKIQVAVDCGPCQLPICPLDLRCMTGVTTDMVMAAVNQILANTPPPTDRRGDAAVGENGANAPPATRV